jgi:hypothetical protein
MTEFGTEEGSNTYCLNVNKYTKADVSLGLSNDI